MKISIILEALTGSFETDVKRASKAAEKAARESREAWMNAGKVIGAAVGAGVTALTALTKQAINTADKMTKMAAGVGLSVESLSTLAYAADRSGVNLDQLRQGLTILAKNASDMAAGTGEAKIAFEALGITVTDTQGKLKGTDQLLMELADEFRGMDDSAQKTAIAVKLFGEAGTRLVPLLNQGASGIGDLQQAARDLGLEIDTTTGKLAEEFNDRLADLGSLAQGLGNDIARELLPSLTELATEAVKSGKEMRNAGGFAEGFAKSLKVLLAAAFATKEAISVLTAGIAATVDVATTSIGILNSLNNLRLGRATADDILRLSTATEDLANVASNAADAFKGQFEESVRSFSDTLTTLFDPLKNAAGGAKDLGDSANNRAAPGLRNAGEAAKEAAEKAKAAAQQWSQYEKFLNSAIDELERMEEAQRDTERRFSQQEQDLRTEIALLGMNTAERQRAIIALEAERMARDETGVVVEEMAARYRDLLTTLAAQQEIAAAAAEFESIWLDAANSVGDALTTALFDGASDGASAIKDVMEQLARDLVRFWIQQKIVIPLQQQIVGGVGGSPGALGGFGGGAFGSTLGLAAGVATGNPLAGALSGFGFASGTFGASAIGSGLSALGITAGLGIAVPIVGALIGAVLSGLFSDDPDPRIRINSSGAGIGDIGTRGSTSLGTLAFNADDLDDERGTERQLLEAIQTLDDGFVQLVTTFGLGEEQMAALRDAAARWSVDLRDSAITAENVLGSRFSALLATFDEDIQAFVAGAGDLEAQFAALSEALFIRAAAEAGQVGDTFDQVREVLERFRVEGEALDQTYARVVASTTLLEEALEYAGVSLDIGRDAFITLANEIVEAAGGLQQAQSLWVSFFETFYSEQERAALQLEQATAAAVAELGDIGLSLDEFTGSEGLARFRALFESVLPSLTADQVVAWLEAARALGILTEVTAIYEDAIGATVGATIDATEAIAEAGRQMRDAREAVGNGLPGLPGSQIDRGGRGGGGGGLPGPGGDDRTLPDEWDVIMRRLLGIGEGGALDGIIRDTFGDDIFGGRPDRDLPGAIDRTVDALNRWIATLDELQRDLLTDETLSVLTPAERLAEVERQYQDAFTGALAGDQESRDLFDQIARQFAEVGRDFFGSSEGYTDIFTRILADIGLLRSTAGAPATSSPALDNLIGDTSGGTGAAVSDPRTEAIVARLETVEDLLRNIATSGNRTATATEATADNTRIAQERTYG